LSIGQTSVGVSAVVVVVVAVAVGVAVVVVVGTVVAAVVVVGVVVAGAVVGGFVVVVVVVGSPPRTRFNQSFRSSPYWCQPRKPSKISAMAAIPAFKNPLRPFFGAVAAAAATGVCSAPQLGQYEYSPGNSFPHFTQRVKATTRE